MGSFSIWHWLIVLVVVLLLFGRGKIPELMGDMAKGIKSFKKGMSDDEDRRRRPRPSSTAPTRPIDDGQGKGVQELTVRTAGTAARRLSRNESDV